MRHLKYFSLLFFIIYQSLLFSQKPGFPFSDSNWVKFDKQNSNAPVLNADYFYKSDSLFLQIFLKNNVFRRIRYKEWIKDIVVVDEQMTFLLIDTLKNNSRIIIEKGLYIWEKSGIVTSDSVELIRLLTIIPTGTGSINIYGFLRKEYFQSDFKQFYNVINKLKIPENLVYKTNTFESLASQLNIGVLVYLLVLIVSLRILFLKKLFSRIKKMLNEF